MYKDKLKLPVILSVLFLEAFICCRLVFSEQVFSQVVNEREKIFGKLLIADDLRTYPVPEIIPRDWEIDNPGEFRDIPNDYFNVGQIRFKRIGNETLVYIKLYRHFVDLNQSLSLEEFRKRVDRLRELKEVQLDITPTLRNLLEPPN